MIRQRHRIIFAIISQIVLVFSQNPSNPTNASISQTKNSEDSAIFHQRGENGDAMLFVRIGAHAFPFQGAVIDDTVAHNLLIAIEILKCLVSFGTVARGEKTC